MFLVPLLVALNDPSPCVLRPDLRIVPWVSHVRAVHQGSAYVVSARINFNVRTVHGAKRTNDPGLQAHVRGYYTIARRIAEPSSARALAPTVAIGRARLARTAATLARDVNLEYRRQIQAYDSVTSNGRTQDQGPAYGFPGGPDARISCPQ